MGQMIKCMTPIFRVSFPNVFVPTAIGNSTDKKYRLTALFTIADILKDPHQKKLWEDILAAKKAVAEEKWPKGLPKDLQNPIRKGEEKEQFDGYGPGVLFMALSTKTKPGLVEADGKTPIINAESFYPGCYARATINPFAWTYAGKHGVSFGVQNIQKWKEGEPFSGRSAPEEDFDASTAEDVRTTTGNPADDMLG